MRITQVLIFLMISLQVSFAHERDCFRQHLLEAIKINQEAKDYYGKLSKGASDRIFRRLIRAERIALVLAFSIDRKAQIYQTHGIPLFCDEFIPMNPNFTPPPVHSPPKERFRSVEWTDFKIDLLRAMRQEDFLEIQRAALKGVQVLELYPQFYCMLRHVLESIARISHFAPSRIEASHRMGLPSPKKLILQLIRLHVSSLEASYEIDEWSEPIQSDGIPLLCQELPRILV